MVTAWQQEVDELHEFFQAYFLGHATTLGRAETVLAPGFAIVGPNGVESGRTATLAALQAGHAHTDSLVITTTDHRLIVETPALIVGSYVEHHQLTERTNARLSTVVFVPEPAAPNGLQWLRVHETWLPA